MVRERGPGPRQQSPFSGATCTPQHRRSRKHGPPERVNDPTLLRRDHPESRRSGNSHRRPVAMTAMTAVTETRLGHSSHSTYATYRPRVGEPAERHHSQEEPVAVKGTSAPWPATATTVEVEKPVEAASAARAAESEAAAGLAGWWCTRKRRVPNGESSADRPLLGLSRGARRAGRRRQRGAVARGCGGREQHALLVGRKPCSDVREPEEDAGADEVEERGGGEPRPLPHDLPVLAPAARRAGAGQRPRTDRVRGSRTR